MFVRLAFSVVMCMLFCTRAQAGFVGGVDGFDGSTLDHETWEVFTESGTTIVQDDAFYIEGNSGYFSKADLTTKFVTVNVGETVSVELTVTEMGDSFWGRAGLILATNEWGTRRSTTSDSHYLFNGLTMYSWGTAALCGVGGQSGFGGSNCGNDSLQIGKTYIYGIERIEQTMVRFSIFDLDGLELVSAESALASPEELYISLYSESANAVFDNVTIVPEPNAVCLFALVGLLLTRRRHRA